MKPSGTSRLPGFYRLEMPARRALIAERLGPESLAALEDRAPSELMDKMIENAVGAVEVPLGVATNFVIDGAEVLVPMAIEEPSVIAAAGNAAKMARAGGGFVTEATPPLMAVQIEILEPLEGAAERLRGAADELRALANAAQPELASLGGGARELIVRPDVGGPDRLVVHLVVDCLDAMGANAVNTMAEAISRRVSELSGGRAGLRILTNLADRRLVRARADIPVDALERRDFSGARVASGIEAASRFAEADPYRAATHNKGIFNGIDAVLLATGNDWRAVEAGGHAFAARGGRYAPLSVWRAKGDSLEGELELPMAVGIVGGAARVHPAARLSLDLLGVETATELGRVAAAVGLASNLAALAALSSEGIQRGHMRLHARKHSGG